MSRAIIKDWTSLPAGREKYQLYLAGREWAILKEAVRSRSGGTCERCRHNPAAQVHHQTYERIYRESIEDLLHLCIPCHEFVSAKRTRDPLLDVPVRLFNRTIRSVYLAGKITGNPWRDQIVPGWSHNDGYLLSPSIISDGNWLTVPSGVPLPDGRAIDLSGPFWRSLRGNWSGDDATFSRAAGDHAYGVCADDTHGILAGTEVDHVKLWIQIRDSIFHSDMIFAWIDSLDCYGTLAEIGFAYGLGKVVMVATPHDFARNDLWLPCYFSFGFIRGTSPATAWKFLWSFYR